MSCRRAALAMLAGACILLHAIRAEAQDEAPQQGQIDPQGQATGEVETLKERLSDKASDEQRVDNCKVPPDRRGPKARPDGCGHDAASAPPAQPSQ